MTPVERRAFSAKLTAALVSEFNRPVIVKEVEDIERRAFVKGLEAARRMLRQDQQPLLFSGDVGWNALDKLSKRLVARIRRERERMKGKP